MRLVDVTLPLGPSSVVYPGDPPLVFSHPAVLARDGFNLTAVSMCLHTGTHIDAPRHFLDSPAGVDAIPLGRLCLAARVYETDADMLNEAALRAFSRAALIRTRNAALLGLPAFSQDYCAVTLDGARYLASHRLPFLGVDYFSVGRGADTAEVHRVLLGADVVIAEGLDLRPAPAGDCFVRALPMKIAGADGAPARVILEVAE